jgi:hypothetical protein
MKLKFNSDAWYNGQLMFESGKIYEVTEEFGFAQRWINRGAEEVVETVINEIVEPEPIEQLNVENDIVMDETKPVEPKPIYGKKGKAQSKKTKEL